MTIKRGAKARPWNAADRAMYTIHQGPAPIQSFLSPDAGKSQRTLIYQDTKTWALIPWSRFLCFGVPPPSAAEA